MINVNCKPHHAVVTIYGVIDEPMMLQLADELQQLHHDCNYNHIELDISSPGGLVRALDYCVEVMERLRAQGVIFTTRALMSAASAAANLVSLGDRRETFRTATFLYHKCIAQGVDEVTAQSAREILTEVDRIDDRYLDRLVQQARRCQAARRALTVRDFWDCDWPVVKHLLIGAGLMQALTDAGKQHARRAQLQQLRKHVSACLATDNGQMLKQFYKLLFEYDRPISAALALELRLVDSFVDTDSRHSSAAPAGGLHVPEWAPLFGPAGWLDRRMLCRHLLFLGETGSGKTLSGILPVVGAIMAPENRAVGCALIIDPKREIKPCMDKMRHSGITLHHIDIHRERQRPALNLMAGDKLSVAADLAGDRFLEAARKILIRSASLSMVSPARVLAGQAANSRDDPYWDSHGARLAVTLLALVLLALKYRRTLFGSDSGTGLFRNVEHTIQRELLSFGEAAGVLTHDYDAVEDKDDVACCVLPDSDIRPAPNVLALADMAMLSWFGVADGTLLVGFITRLLQEEITGGDAKEIYRQVKYWVQLSDRADRTFQCIMSSARGCFFDYTDATTAGALYFGVEPYYCSVMTYGRADLAPVDFTAAVNDEEARSVYIFQPDLNNNDALIAKAIKAAWFEAILSSRKRMAQGGTMPMAAYIADEFHRFITSDKVHGEQSFLDTCRSFGAFCALACQSISSMEHALAESCRNSDQNKAAVSILLNNTANKLFFRSTDKKVQEYLDYLCPSLPDLGQVTSVRPASTLQPGECYASLADGRFERRQLLPFQTEKDNVLC